MRQIVPVDSSHYVVLVWGPGEPRRLMALDLASGKYDFEHKCNIEIDVAYKPHQPHVCPNQ